MSTDCHPSLIDVELAGPVSRDSRSRRAPCRQTPSRRALSRRALGLSRSRRALSLLELPQGLIIVGLLAAFLGVPKVLQNAERGKASVAFSYLECVQRAQARHFDQTGRYANEVSTLDVDRCSPAYYAVGLMGATDSTWSLTLTRSGGRTGGYGAYTVTYTQDGYDAGHSSIDRALCPRHY